MNEIGNKKATVFAIATILILVSSVQAINSVGVEPVTADPIDVISINEDISLLDLDATIDNENYIINMVQPQPTNILAGSITIYVNTSAIDGRGDLNESQKTALKQHILDHIKSNFEGALGEGNATVTDDPTQQGSADRNVSIQPGMSDPPGSAWGQCQGGNNTVEVYLGEFMNDSSVNGSFQNPDGSWNITNLGNAIGHTAGHEVAHTYSVGHNHEERPEPDVLLLAEDNRSKMTAGENINAGERANSGADSGFVFDDHTNDVIGNNLGNDACEAFPDYDMKVLLAHCYGPTTRPDKPDEAGSLDVTFDFYIEMPGCFELGFLGEDTDDGLHDGNSEFDFIYKTSLLRDENLDAKILTFISEFHEQTTWLLRGSEESSHPGEWFMLDEENVFLWDSIVTPAGDIVARKVEMSWPSQAVSVFFDALSFGDASNPHNGFTYEVVQPPGWYWKPGYPNYAPSGMPDFDQKQDQWQRIDPGPNGVLESTVVGDDVNNGINIAPGPNCRLDTQPSGDDVVKWAFCGPVAVANCFWWFDSKYANPDGVPGDGEDTFPLVQDYSVVGVDDDHSSGNVPLLIEKLASAMQTCDKGTTDIHDMEDAIDQWFSDTGLNNMFEENTYDAPTFEFIEREIERSQDVILLLGYYDYEKIVDQSQIQWTFYVDLPTSLPGHLQSFTPSVNVLDAVQVLLAANNPGVLTDVEVCIWDQLPIPGILPLGCSMMTITPPGLDNPEWFQFHFDPSISLMPGEGYFISVKELTMDYNIHWYYHEPDIYSGGTAWWATDDWIFVQQYDKDFAFETEYYGAECVRKGGHYVTCAGVNSDEFKIAFSDPRWDISDPSPSNHNDAQYVSHDIYGVSIGSPCPGLLYQWWLPDYPAEHDYTIVEQAVVICPKPDVEINKWVWDGSEWVDEIDANVGETVSFKIDVHNNGGYDLTNIQVVDTLPFCLDYVAGSADPTPTSVDGKIITWNFPGPLSHCNTITIIFDAEVVSVGENINTVGVDADAYPYPEDPVPVTVSDSDTAIVHAFEPLVPSVDIEKYVWNETLGEWVDEISAEVCTIIRFNLSIHNTGQVTLIVTKVLDILPPCLEYADSATVNGMPWEPDVKSPPNYEWNYPLPADYWGPGSEPGELPPGEWIYIEFDVHVISEGININEACVDADSAGWPVSDCDTATVSVPPEFIVVTILSYKWNMISVPFNYSVNKADFYVEYGGTYYTWADAVSGGIVANALFGWNRISQGYEQPSGGILEPGCGYWMWAYHDCILKVLES